MKSRPQVGTAQGWGHQGDPRRPCSGGEGRGLCPSRQDRGFILWGHSHLLFLPLPAPGPGGGQVAPGKGSPRLHGGGHEAQSTVPCPPSCGDQTRRALRTRAWQLLGGPPGRSGVPFTRGLSAATARLCNASSALRPAASPRRSRLQRGLAVWTGCAPPPPSPEPRDGITAQARTCEVAVPPGSAAASGPRWVGGRLWAQVPHGEGRGSGEPPRRPRGEEGREV